MADPHILTTLRAKQSELERTIKAYEAKIGTARAYLAHVNATLQLFETGGQPRPSPLRMSLRKMFGRCEVWGYCKQALEASADGLDTRELALVVIRAREMNEDDAVLRNAMAFTVLWTLHARFKRGQVFKLPEKRKGVVVWRLASKLPG